MRSSSIILTNETEASAPRYAWQSLPSLVEPALRMLGIRLYTFCCPRRTGLSHWGHYQRDVEQVSELPPTHTGRSPTPAMFGTPVHVPDARQTMLSAQPMQNVFLGAFQVSRLPPTPTWLSPLRSIHHSMDRNRGGMLGSQLGRRSSHEARDMPEAPRTRRRGQRFRLDPHRGLHPPRSSTPCTQPLQSFSPSSPSRRRATSCAQPLQSFSPISPTDAPLFQR